MSRAVAVVGAGWAGLAAALALAEAGVPVTLFDAAPVAGGRARSAPVEPPFGRTELDNGQHLIVGAYRETLALIDRLGAAPLLRRSALQLQSPSGFAMRAAPLPAPLHLGWALARASGLGARERLALLALMARLRSAGWRTPAGETVSGLLVRLRQPPRLVARLWAPLCIGALNTMPEAACAQAFAVVLRDTLGAGRKDADFVTSDSPLGELLPEPALRRLRQLGATLRLRSAVREIRRSPDGWSLRASGDDASGSIGASGSVGASGSIGAPGSVDPSGSIDVAAGTKDKSTHSPAFAAVLLALPPWSAQRLLAPLGLDVAPLRAFEPEPIATAWAFWPADDAPALPLWSLLDEDPARGHYGQWLFDRGVIGKARVGGVVISVASRTDALPAGALTDGIAGQLHEAFGDPRPTALRIVTERRATFRCVPGRPRLGIDHFEREAAGLWLAGDWLWPDYPATIEAAVRSGRQAGAAIASRFTD